jgi:hypothetical protein
MWYFIHPQKPPGEWVVQFLSLHPLIFSLLIFYTQNRTPESHIKG